MVGVFSGAFAEREPGRNEANLGELVAWFRDGRIRPHVDATYPLEKAVDALRGLRRGT